jgi:predicted ribosomally synthesized peptide with SipW-like signal peptide
MRRKESDEKMKCRVAGLFAVVLISLAVLGFSYALWTETLTISGTITTGELDVAFTGTPSKNCSDYMTCTVTLKDGGEPDLPGHTDMSEMIVTVDNAYPCGWCNITFTITNVGTIPAKVTGITINNPAQLSVTLEGINVGDTIAVSGSKVCTLKIHVEESAAESTSYTFTLTLSFGQFNA